MSILILAEHNNEDVKSSTLSTIGAASKISSDIEVLVVGSNTEGICKEISNYQNIKNELDKLIDDFQKKSLISKNVRNNNLIQVHNILGDKYHIMVNIPIKNIFFIYCNYFLGLLGVRSIKKYPNKVDSNEPVNTPILTPSIYCIFSAKAKFPTKRLIVKPIPVSTPTP